jgi:hypothetical protein
MTTAQSASTPGNPTHRALRKVKKVVRSIVRRLVAKNAVAFTQQQRIGAPGVPERERDGGSGRLTSNTQGSHSEEARCAVGSRRRPRR